MTKTRKQRTAADEHKLNDAMDNGTPILPEGAELGDESNDKGQDAAHETDNGVADLVDVEEEHTPNSVVKGEYKRKYAERAVAMARKPKGVPLKALKRSNTDWLAIELAKRTLDEKAKLVVPSLEAILDANGIRHSHWNRTTKGWQGRLRMTGRLALQRVVAEDGELVLPDGSTIPAPKAWCAKHAN